MMPIAYTLTFISGAGQSDIIKRTLRDGLIPWSALCRF